MTERDEPRGSLVTVGQVARWTGRCTRTISRWVCDGLVPGQRVRGRKRDRYYVARDAALALRDGRYVFPSHPVPLEPVT